METCLRRRSRSSLSEALVTSWSLIETLPWVGSISRVRQRTRVDLPEPESPITTNTSPGATSKETSRTPTTQPCFSFSSARDSFSSGVPITLSAWDPKIFHNESTFNAAVIAAPHLRA